MEIKNSFEKTNDDPPDSSFLSGEKVLLAEPKRGKGSFFVGKKISIRAGIIQRGFRISVDEKKFDIIYPKIFWKKYPNSLKKALLENLAFIFTLHLPYLLKNNNLDYQMPKPIFKDLILDGFINSLPSTALMKCESTSNLLQKFSQIKYLFKEEKNSILNPPLIKTKNSAVLAFSFGKDSLLTLGLCWEIGINPIPIYVEEPLTYWENYHKRILAKKFFKEFGQKILFLKNEVGSLREPGKNGWYGWELQLTQFGLIALPITYTKRVRYLFFANEQSCNDKFLDREGFFCNPVYEQSVEWLLKLREIIETLGTKNLQVGSLVEPLHELAIIKILHHRYPKIAKYQMSCGEVEGKKNRWCGNCSKCARIYIFLLANNIDPKKVDFPTEMLKIKFKNKFSLFNGKNGNYGYDKSALGRDEQLCSFLLAYQNGYRGELIDLFKKLYLKEAKAREKELRKKFFGIHSTTTIPEELRNKVLLILKEELTSLTK